MNREDFRTGVGQTTHTEEDQGMDKINRGRSRYDSNYRGSCRHNMRGNQRYRRQNNNNNRKGNFRNQNYDRNRSRSY